MIYVTPPAIAKHMRAGHNWNFGILKWWSNGFWGRWVIDNIYLDRV